MKLLALMVLATPVAAEGADPAAVPVSPQLERMLGEGPEQAMAQIAALMERIGRADGIVLATLAEDDARAREDRVARAVGSLVALDANGDGVLTRLEVSRQRSDWSASHLQTFFTEFDTDETGRVDATEIETGVRLRAEEVASTAILQDLAPWDLDGDGTVAPSEIEAVVLARTGAGG